MKGNASQEATQTRPMTAARASGREPSATARVYWNQCFVAADMMCLLCLVLMAPALCQALVLSDSTSQQAAPSGALIWPPAA